MFNLSIAIEYNSVKFPKKKAFIQDKKSISYEEFNRITNQLANAIIDSGIKPGDKIAIQCPNIIEFPIIYFGILKMGGVVVPLSILLKKNEVLFFLKNSQTKMFFVYQGNKDLPIFKESANSIKYQKNLSKIILIENNDLEKISPDELITTYSSFLKNKSEILEFYPSDPSDTAVIIYTSGTTGDPKGAELTHSNLGWNANLTGDLFEFNKEDIVLTVLPLFHIYGQSCLMNASIFKGLTNILVSRFDPNLVLNEIKKNKVTVFAGVPTMFWSLCNIHKIEKNRFHKSQNKSWRIAISGGAALPLELLNKFEKNFQVPIYEGYGMSEGSPLVSYNHPGYKRKVGSVGFPVWGVKVKIIDENNKSVPNGKVGQLIFRGHNVMKGYFNNQEASKKALKGGWMHSGDLAYKDDDGYYFIVDRIKDIIIRGGVNIYPREIEEVLIKHPKISLVAVKGIFDERLGEEIKAYVVLKEEEKVTSKELQNWVKKKIAANKYPRHIDIVNKLPISASGKILKRLLD